MPRTVRAALIQAHANLPKEEALVKHVEMVEEAARQGAQIACLQEIFFGPYFCAEQDPKWFETAESDNGPTAQTMKELARKHELVLVVPFFEKEFEGVFYNTALVIDADGTVLGKYRKTHIPQVGPIFWEKYFFKPGNLGYPVFDTRVGKVGVFTATSLSRQGCWASRAPDHFQSVGHDREPLPLPVGTRAACARRRERLLRRRDQPGGRGARRRRTVLRVQLLL